MLTLFYYSFIIDSMPHLQLVRESDATVEAIAALHQPEAVHGQRLEQLGHAAVGLFEAIGTAVGATVIAHAVESPMPVTQKGFYIGVLAAASIALGRDARNRFKTTRT